MLVLQIALGVALGLLLYHLLVKTRVGVWLAYAVGIVLAALVALGAGWFVWTRYRSVIDTLLTISGGLMIVAFVLGATKGIRDRWPDWNAKKRREVLVGGGGLHFLMSASMAGPASEHGYGFLTFFTLWLVPYILLLVWFRLPRTPIPLLDWFASN